MVKEKRSLSGCRLVIPRNPHEKTLPRILPSLSASPKPLSPIIKISPRNPHRTCHCQLPQASKSQSRSIKLSSEAHRKEEIKGKRTKTFKAFAKLVRWNCEFCIYFLFSEYFC